MNDIKIAILRTFESTVKALLADGGGGMCGEMECVFDANSRGNSADLGEICAELREIRTELAEMRTQITKLETRLEKKEKEEECCGGAKKVANIVVNDVWPTADDIDDDMFRHSLLGQMPIPLRGPEFVKPVSIVEPVVAAVAAPITPELRPRAEETEEHVPDITEVEEECEEEIAQDDEGDTGVEGDYEGEEEEQEVEEEEEEEGLEEVEYKGVTYYKDKENLAYTLNDEGELNEDPVGRWYEDKKIVKFFPTQIRK